MSLLNDMLRDLSQDLSRPQQIDAEKNAGKDADFFRSREQRELFAQSSAAKPLPRRLLPSILVFVVVLVGIVGVQYFLPEKPVSSTAEPAPLLSEIVQEIPTPDAVVTLSPALDERLAALESAVTKLGDAVVSAQQNTATEYTVVEPEVEPVNPDTTTPEQTASVSIQDPFSNTALNQRENSDSNEVVDNEPVNGEVTGGVGDPSLFIAPNPAWQDRQFAIRMREMFQAGQAAQSVAQLQAFVTSHANSYESTILLLDILCEQENAVAAQQALQQAGFLPAVEKTYYAAKIALLTGHDAEAISMLESALPEAENHEQYRALLAGLYQRTGMNQEAASHYRRLLSVFGEKPAYWLGFALAQDALNQSQLAVQAYQRVNQYSDLQPQVRQYIEQRLQVLQQ
jgi:MSHA biogenesis protein MshN